MNNAGVFNQLKEAHGDKIQLMPEDTDCMIVHIDLRGRRNETNI